MTLRLWAAGGGGRVRCLESQCLGDTQVEVCAIHSFIHAAVKSVIHSSSEYCRPTVRGGSWVWETDWDPNKKALNVRTRGSGFGL